MDQTVPNNYEIQIRKRRRRKVKTADNVSSEHFKKWKCGIFKVFCISYSL